MDSSPTNLRPYGDAWANTTAPEMAPGSYESAALDRAIRKLEIVRRRSTTKLGPNLNRLALAGFVSVFPFGIAMLVVVAMLEESPVRTGIVIPIAIMLSLLGVLALIAVRSIPSSPKLALQEFYRCVGRGNYRRARKLVVPPDHDSFTRFQPAIRKLGRPTGIGFQFHDERSFKQYWNELVRSHPSPYCNARVRKLHVTDVAPGVKLVEFELKLIMNSSLWLLLVFVTLLLAIIADLVTRKTVTAPMRKLLVEVDGQWHLFSGEWCGYDEFDLSWLQHLPN